MKLKSTLTVITGGLALAFAPFSHAAVLAGIDFDVPSGASHTPPSFTWTESGHLSVPATTAKDYNVIHNGITFDIKTTYANQGNANRYRGGATAANPLNNLTPMTVDFIQWYGRNAAGPVEAAITLTGLAANTNYTLSFYMYNAGAGQTTHSFYEGPVAPENLLSTFTTAGNQNTPATWVPNVDYTLTSDITGKIVVTIVAPQFDAGGGNTDSRLTFNGMSVIPEPSTIGLLALSGLALFRRRR